MPSGASAGAMSARHSRRAWIACPAAMPRAAVKTMSVGCSAVPTAASRPALSHLRFSAASRLPAASAMPSGSEYIMPSVMAPGNAHSSSVARSATQRSRARAASAQNARTAATPEIKVAISPATCRLPPVMVAASQMSAG
jgi:hypothetical protein